METRHGLARIYTGITFIFVGHFIGIYPIGFYCSPRFFSVQGTPWQNSGVYDRDIVNFTNRTKSKKSENYSRALHSLIHRDDKTLPVEIASVQTKVRIPRKRKVLLRPWPVIPLNNWMKLCFSDSKYSGFFFLAGKTLDEWVDAQNMLKEFWSRYGKIDPTMVPTNPSQTIPVYLHGDEGRGLGKRPLLVISFQPVMSWVGANTIPSTKHLAIKGLV